jgi:hypothetical protein
LEFLKKFSRDFCGASRFVFIPFRKFPRANLLRVVADFLLRRGNYFGMTKARIS